MDTVMAIGHRGASGYLPENTVPSFRRAIGLGAGMVELDVRCCADGRPVVIHDAEVDRTTNGTGPVALKTLAELRRLDAGGGERIPLLEEVFDAVGGRVRVNIELKEPGTARPVVAAVERQVSRGGRSYGAFLVSSFLREELLTVHRAAPSIPTGVLVGAGDALDTAFCRSVGASSVHLGLGAVSRETVARVHGEGMAVYVWTVDSPEDIRRVAELGVDGIFTNFPDRVSGFAGP